MYYRRWSVVEDIPTLEQWERGKSVSDKIITPFGF